MRLRITARDPFGLAEDEMGAPIVLRADEVVDLPDTTAEFLAAVARYGRFSVDMSTMPPTLHFENDYD